MVEVGEILEGKVTGLTNFGAFIKPAGQSYGYGSHLGGFAVLCK